MAACIPTFRPVYLVVLGKPGANSFPSKKQNYCIHSSDRDGTLVALTKKDSASHAFVSGGSAALSGQVVGHPVGGIKRTVDLDVSYDDSKYLNRGEDSWVDAHDVV